MSAEFDLRELRRAFHEVQRATKKDGADILNRAGRNVCLRAIKATPKADAGKIRTELQSGGLARGLALQAAKAAGRRLTGAEITAAAAKLVRMRLRSVAYIKAGWIMAARAFGAASGSRVSRKGLAGQGYGEKATPAKLEAVMANCARGADQVGLDAFQGAINFVAKDMLAYAAKRLGETWRRNSAR